MAVIRHLIDDAQMLSHLQRDDAGRGFGGDDIAHGVAQKNLNDGTAEHEQSREPKARLPPGAAIEERFGENEEFLEEQQAGFFAGGRPAI